MRLVKDDHAVPIQIALVQRLPEENTVRHVYKRSFQQLLAQQDLKTSHLILVSGDVQSSNRIAYPTVEPSLHYMDVLEDLPGDCLMPEFTSISSLTRFATDIAATRRG
jgi:hypothetical protein